MSGSNLTYADGVAPARDAAALNGWQNEGNNLITSGGLTVNTGVFNQEAQSVSALVHGANWYTDSGTGAAYVLTITASVIAPVAIPAYADGNEFRFRAGNANTVVAPTVNVSTLGAKVIVLQDGSALALGDINTSVDMRLRYDSALGKAILLNPQVSVAVSLPRGYLSGIKLENAADADHDITFNIGQCRDDANTFSILFNSALTKQIDAPFATGDNAGGLASGSVAIDTTYHCFVISTPDGVEDAIFDISEVGANIAAAAPTYTKFRRVGYVITDGSSNIVPSSWLGNRNTYDVPSQDFSATEGTTASIRTLSRAPLGMKMNIGVIAAASYNNISSRNIRWSDPDAPDIVPDASNSQIVAESTVNPVNDNSKSVFEIVTNNASQVRTRASNTGADHGGTVIYVDDLRGQL